MLVMNVPTALASAGECADAVVQVVKQQLAKRVVAKPVRRCGSAMTGARPRCSMPPPGRGCALLALRHSFPQFAPQSGAPLTTKSVGKLGRSRQRL